MIQPAEKKRRRKNAETKSKKIKYENKKSGLEF